MPQLSFIDIISIILLIIFFIIGLKRGLVREVSELLGIVGGIFCGVVFEDLMEPIVVSFLGDFTGVEIGTMIITFFIVAVFLVLIGKVLSKFIKFVGLDMVDKITGGIFGMIKVFVGIVLICMVLFLFDSPKLKQTISTSYTGQVVNYVLQQINYEEHTDEIKNLKP